jgi:hypothetical protein
MVDHCPVEQPLIAILESIEEDVLFYVIGFAPHIREHALLLRFHVGDGVGQQAAQPEGFPLLTAECGRFVRCRVGKSGYSIVFSHSRILKLYQSGSATSRAAPRILPIAAGTRFQPTASAQPGPSPPGMISAK